MLSLLAPSACINCATEGNVLCQECQELLKPLGNICCACGKSIRNFKLRPGCNSKWSPNKVWVYAEYSGLAKELIKYYKFDGSRQAATEISGLMNDSLPFFVSKPIVTFVPTSLDRKRSRGFDHAELLDKEIARTRKWLMAPLIMRQSKVRQLGSTRFGRKQ